MLFRSLKMSDAFKFSLYLFAIAIVVFISFLIAWPVKELWNGCLVPAVDGVHDITWLQSWGISILFGLLFKPQINNNFGKKNG